MLERVAIDVEPPRRTSSDQPTDDHDLSQAYLEYLCLRMALVGGTASYYEPKPANRRQSLRQNRLELAEHFFVRIDMEQATRTPAVAEDIVDLFLEIGKAQLDAGSCDMACVWLERAFELLQNQDLERLSPNAGELRLDLLHLYGTSCCWWPIFQLMRVSKESPFSILLANSRIPSKIRTDSGGIAAGNSHVTTAIGSN